MLQRELINISEFQRRVWGENGKDGQKLAGHASQKMTKNYEADHEEVVWTEAVADLDLSKITG